MSRSRAGIVATALGMLLLALPVSDPQAQADPANGNVRRAVVELARGREDAGGPPAEAAEGHSHDAHGGTRGSQRGHTAAGDRRELREDAFVAATPPLDAGQSAMVGASWTSDAAYEVRVEADGKWSDWMRLVRDAEEHVPDPGTQELAEANLDASEAIWVGDVDRVQFRGTQAGQLSATFVESPDPSTSVQAASVSSPSTPLIRPRASWGADESIKDPGSPSYSSSGTVRFSVVHHEGASTRWTDAEIERGCWEAASRINAIYRYHVLVRGWDDIAYNFIVDPCGGIWEGRAGGVSLPIIGAHAGGWNDGSVGVLALGTFSGSNPDSFTSAMRASIERIIGYKLGLDRVDPGSSSDEISGGGSSRYPPGTPVTVPVLSAHQITNATSCPGWRVMEALFNGSAQHATPTTAYVNNVRGDLVPPVINHTSWNFSGGNLPGRIVHNPITHRLTVHEPAANGGFGGVVQTRTLRDGWDIVATGDWNGDGQQGVALLDVDKRILQVHAGTSWGGLGTILYHQQLHRRWDIVAAGDWDGDGTDSIGLYSAGRTEWQVHEGNDGGALGSVLSIKRFKRPWDLVIAGDWNGDQVEGIAMYNKATKGWRVHAGSADGDLGPTLQTGHLQDHWSQIDAGDWAGTGRDGRSYYNHATGRLLVYSVAPDGSHDDQLLATTY